MKIIANLINVAALCALIGVGAFYWKEAHAQERVRGISVEDRECLAKNIFFEARNQSVLGQVSVAWVTLNRMESERFPNTICEVVKQGHQDSAGNMIRHQCQFSWYCDGRSDRIPSNAVAQRAWEDAQLVAEVVLLDWARDEASPVENATMYHANYVDPYWSTSYNRVTQIDDHIFYE